MRDFLRSALQLLKGPLGKWLIVLALGGTGYHLSMEEIDRLIKTNQEGVYTPRFLYSAPPHHEAP